MKIGLAFKGLLAVLAAATVFHQPQAHAARPGRQPRLATLDHPGMGEGLYIDPALLLGDGIDFATRVAARSSFQFGGGAGLAIDLSATHASFDNGSETAISNVGLWGFFATRSRQTRYIGRLGATIGSAPGGGGAGANLLSHRIKIQDLALAIPEAFTLRLGGSALSRSGPWFWRADGGVDVFLANAGELLAPLLHAGVAGGYDAGSVALALELANVLALEDRLLGGDHLFSTLAFTANFPDGWFASLVVPLDSPGDLWGVSFGLFALAY